MQIETTQFCDFKKVATRLAKNGYRVFPVVKGTKKPAITGWPKYATTNIETIAKFADRWPDANVGICTTGMITFDIDTDRGGDEGFAALVKEYGEFPETAKTQRGENFHLSYLLPPGICIHQSANALAQGVDIKGWHNYVMAPGSFHGKSGMMYEEVVDAAKIIECPEHLIQAIRDKCPESVSQLQQSEAQIDWDGLSEEDKEQLTLNTFTDEVVERFPVLSPGTRHAVMVRMASWLRYRSSLTPEQRVIIGQAWLSRFQSVFASSYEEANFDLIRCLKDFEKAPIKDDWTNRDKVTLSEQIEVLIPEIFDDPRDANFFRVVMKEHVLDQRKGLEEIEVRMKDRDLRDGYQEMTGLPVTLHQVTKFKKKYFTTPSYEASEIELFRMLVVGVFRKNASTYEFTNTLVELLELQSDVEPKQFSGPEDFESEDPFGCSNDCGFDGFTESDYENFIADWERSCGSLPESVFAQSKQVHDESEIEEYLGLWVRAERFSAGEDGCDNGSGERVRESSFLSTLRQDSRCESEDSCGSGTDVGSRPTSSCAMGDLGEDDSSRLKLRFVDGVRHLYYEPKELTGEALEVFKMLGDYDAC